MKRRIISSKGEVTVKRKTSDSSCATKSNVIGGTGLVATNNTSTIDNLTTLPGELILEILENLSMYDLYMVGQTCRRLNHLAVKTFNNKYPEIVYRKLYLNNSMPQQNQICDTTHLYPFIYCFKIIYLHNLSTKSFDVINKVLPILSEARRLIIADSICFDVTRLCVTKFSELEILRAQQQTSSWRSVHSQSSSSSSSIESLSSHGSDENSPPSSSHVAKTHTIIDYTQLVNFSNLRYFKINGQLETNTIEWCRFGEKMRCVDVTLTHQKNVPQLKTLLTNNPQIDTLVCRIDERGSAHCKKMLSTLQMINFMHTLRNVYLDLSISENVVTEKSRLLHQSLNHLALIKTLHISMNSSSLLLNIWHLKRINFLRLTMIPSLDSNSFTDHTNCKNLRPSTFENVCILYIKLNNLGPCCVPFISSFSEVRQLHLYFTEDVEFENIENYLLKIFHNLNNISHVFMYINVSNTTKLKWLHKRIDTMLNKPLLVYICAKNTKRCTYKAKNCTMKLTHYTFDLCNVENFFLPHIIEY